MITFFAGLTMTFLNSYGQNHCLVSIKDAEKILGQSAQISADSSETTNHTIKSRCTFTTSLQQPHRDRESNLYYLLEEYPNATAAETAFKFIVSENQGMPGLQTLHGLGDEAIIQTDNFNYQLIMVRKSDKIIRMKVNKITPTTSLGELTRIAKNISDHL
jgi:hypothetical protein